MWINFTQFLLVIIQKMGCSKYGNEVINLESACCQKADVF